MRLSKDSIKYGLRRAISYATGDVQRSRLITRTSRFDPAALAGMNSYWKDIGLVGRLRKEHRDMVGGLWEEIGLLQFHFMKEQGLNPKHKFLDVGCGAMRGGLHFVEYLNYGNYYGIDINPSLLKAGISEIRSKGLLDKNPQLLENSKFEAFRFAIQFDYVIAQSVFTHLFINQIGRCLKEISKILKQDGKFFATFFEAPSALHLDSIKHEPGHMVTNWDSDPFHYSYSEMESLGKIAGLRTTRIGSWDHPRNQMMLLFNR